MNRNRLQLDFAQAAPRSPKLGWLLLVAGAALALLCLTEVADALAAKASYREALSGLQTSPATPQARPQPKEGRDPREAARNLASRQVSASLHSPWADLLEAIEATPKDSVALLSIEPSAVKRTVRITAEAGTSQAMLAHLKTLQSDARLADVSLISHERRTQVPGAPWRYQIQGSW